MGRPRTGIQHRVLLAARARFLADGVDGASLRTIAKSAKTSVGMIFYYYPTKDALFLAVVEDVYAKFLGDIQSLLVGKGPLKDRLRATFTRVGHATPDEIDVLRLVVREALVASPRFGQVLARFGRGHVGVLVSVLGEAASRGEVDASIPLPLLAVTTLAMGGVPQVARRLATGDLPFASLPPAERLAEMAVATLFGGIGPKPKPPPTSRRKRR
jgi:AcrR family transcriptional regulator